MRDPSIFLSATNPIASIFFFLGVLQIISILFTLICLLPGQQKVSYNRLINKALVRKDVELRQRAVVLQWWANRLGAELQKASQRRIRVCLNRLRVWSRSIRDGDGTVQVYKALATLPRVAVREVVI